MIGVIKGCVFYKNKPMSCLRPNVSPVGPTLDCSTIELTMESMTLAKPWFESVAMTSA